MKSGRAVYVPRSLYTSYCLRAEGVLTNNQMGQSSGPCRFCGGLNKARHVPTALLVRVQCLRESLYMAVEGSSIRYIVLSIIPGSYCLRVEGVLLRHCCSRGNAISWATDTSKFVNKITIKDLVGDSFCYIFLKRKKSLSWHNGHFY